MIQLSLITHISRRVESPIVETNIGTRVIFYNIAKGYPILAGKDAIASFLIVGQGNIYFYFLATTEKYCSSVKWYCTRAFGILIHCNNLLMIFLIGLIIDMK